jgi:hypothetical protein
MSRVDHGVTMTDKQGLLTEGEKQKFAAWLSSHGIPPAVCPFCGSREWTIGDHLIQPVTLGPNMSMQLGGVGYPQLMLISNKCGHTVLFNAVIAGIVVSNLEPDKK